MPVPTTKPPLGVTGVMLPELDLDEQIQLCLELGITHYVIRPRVIPDVAVGKPWNSHGNHRFDLPPDRLLTDGPAIGDRLRAAGLVAYCTVPVETADADDTAHDLNFRGAAAAGFTRIKITPIAYPPGLFDYADYLDRATARYRHLCDLARPHGLRIVIEMHALNSASSPGLARLLLDRFDPAELGVILDLPNFAREGFVEPNLAISVLADWIDHVHLGGYRRIKGRYDELGFVHTGGLMCSLAESDLHIPTWLTLVAQLGRPVPLIIEDYSPGMSGAARCRRTAGEVHHLLAGLEPAS